jgi:hypothetical protein
MSSIRWLSAIGLRPIAWRIAFGPEPNAEKMQGILPSLEIVVENASPFSKQSAIG